MGVPGIVDSSVHKVCAMFPRSCANSALAGMNMAMHTDVRACYIAPKLLRIRPMFI
jgi:hypothetical protein